MMKATILRYILGLILVLTLSSIVVASGETSKASIFIDGNGVATLTMTISLSSGLNIINLPVKPIQATIVTKPDVSWFYNSANDTLLILSTSSMTIEISYIVNTSLSNGVLTLTINTKQPIDLILSPNILLLSVPENIISYKIQSDGIQILTINGSATVSYIISQPQQIITQPAPTTTIPTETPIKIPTQTTLITSATTSYPPATSAPTATPAPAGLELRNLLLMVAVAIIIIAVVAVLIKRR